MVNSEPCQPDLTGQQLRALVAGARRLSCFTLTGLLLLCGHVRAEDERNALMGLSTYRPVYLAYGKDPIHHLKFQLSFKYRFWNPLGGKQECLLLSGLHFAYSQKSFWDLAASSAPFADVNYNPELFYLFENLRPDWLPEHMALHLQLGYSHESNGEGSALSRSWDRAYIESALVMGDCEKLHLRIAPRLWTITNTEWTNADIAEYMGYGELRLSCGWPDAGWLELLLRKGTEGSHGAVEANLSYPLYRVNRHFSMFFLLQANYGQGDSLLSFREDQSVLRAGLMLVR